MARFVTENPQIPYFYPSVNLNTPLPEIWGRKPGGVCEDEAEKVDLPDEAEFTLNVSRGKLKLPPINLYDFSQYCYCFFKARKNKCCTKIYLEAFSMIHDDTDYSFENVDSIIRRLCNCFFKAFVKKETDMLKAKNKKVQNDACETKRRRISAKD